MINSTKRFTMENHLPKTRKYMAFFSVHSIDCIIINHCTERYVVLLHILYHSDCQLEIISWSILATTFDYPLSFTFYKTKISI